MRDPLSLVPVRYKLPLTFALLCVVAFGLGGYVVTTTAREALEEQIRLRLDDRAANTHFVVDKDLELLGRRLEDFASDGHIRLEMERIQGDDASPDAKRELVRHLRSNKLPLVPELVDAHVLAADGRMLLSAYAEGAAGGEGFDRERLWFGPVTGADDEHPYPTFLLSTPVTAIDGARRLGYLQVVVRADRWADRIRRSLSRSPLEGLAIGLRMPGGYRLPLVTPREGDGGGTDALSFSSPNARTGWEVELSVDRRTMTLPVDVMVATFLYVGLALVVLTFLLLIPSRQFLLKPLGELERAARRITAGDFSARVGYRSDDEVGHLSDAFDAMAEAVEERTRRLARTAERLEEREREVRIERDRLNAVIASMEDGLFILDRSGRVTLANTAAQSVIGELRRRRDGAPRDCARASRAPGHCFACLADYQQGSRSCVTTIGERSWDIQATSLRDPEGRETGRVFVSRDVTERLRQAARQAHQERLSVLGEVAAVMAHEMNSPLAAISMFSQMLLEGLEPSSPLRAHAEVVHRNMVACRSTLRSLLDMATTSASEPEALEVHCIVDEVVELLGPVAQRAGARLEVELGAVDGEVWAADLQLRQALLNLVMNAIQSAGGAEGEPRIVTLATRGDDREVAIEVRDNGPGIPDELAERIFEPFFTTKPPGQGTGLGLPTTRRILESMGGRLELEPRVERGACFRMVLPRSGGRTVSHPATAIADSAPQVVARSRS